MEKLNSLPGIIHQGLEAVSVNLEQVTRRLDVLQDPKNNLEKAREAIFIQHAREAEKERNPDYRWE